MTETTVVTVRVPMMPPAECSPNARLPWRVRAAAAKEWRQQAFYAAYGLAPLPAGTYVMDVHVSWQGKRRGMDDDNLIAACKPARDGLADVLLAGEDAHIRIGEVSQDHGEGVTWFTLRRMDDAK